MTARDGRPAVGRSVRSCCDDVEAKSCWQLEVVTLSRFQRHRHGATKPPSEQTQYYQLAWVSVGVSDDRLAALITSALAGWRHDDEKRWWGGWMLWCDHQATASFSERTYKMNTGSSLDSCSYIRGARTTTIRLRDDFLCGPRRRGRTTR